MSIPTLAPTIRVGRSLAIGALALTLAIAACNGSVAATVAPSVAIPTLAPSLTAHSPSTPTTTSTASATTAAGPTVTPAPSLKPLTLLWQKGGPTHSQPATWQPAVDPATGDVWVAAPFDNVFWIFSPDGKYLESWGTPGKGDGQLALATHEENPTPRGSIAFTADGGFYVADTGNDRVQKFDKNRHYVMQFGGFGHQDGKFTRPLDIATDGKTIYVSDDDKLQVEAFDMDGKFLRTLPWTDYGMITIDATGRIVTTTGGEVAPTALAVFVIDPLTGQPVATYPVPPIGRVLLGGAVDAAGDIFVNVAPNMDSAPHTMVGLVELDKTGTVIGTWSTAGETIAVAPDGKAIYLASDWPFIRKYALPAP